MDHSSAELLARYETGDDDAATEIFDRYVQRLTSLARSRLSVRLARRIDADDVIQSTFRSFFVGAQQGRFSLRRSGDLWRLLVGITMRKVLRGVDRHTAAKRSVDAESHSTAEFALAGIAVSSAPDPADAVALVDELESVMTSLDDYGRRVLELRLQGEQISVIASETNRSERTTRRTLAAIRQELSSRWESTDA